ncbi:hypothetical protein [Fulvivirga lutimaris]|uniref:hypothetical protein n=1 Tax=Fulvivirga lutimaris TaxID=1819566 RepID=UPI0012BB9D1D|nr:hypothetical protein [Fulvivirga lutimaris]MTI38161.1 hypothetical protein [Fulvivirga lutimaris]
MKTNSQLFVSVLILTSSIIFQNCKPQQKVSDSEKLISYEVDIKPLMVRSCTPCHFPENGKKKMLDTHDKVVADISEIIRRIELQPEEKGYMPFKSKREAFSPEEIALLKTWVDQGMKG